MIPQTKDLGMTEINTENPLHFAPSVVEPDETTLLSRDNNGECSASQIFARHLSLAELSSIAVSEKQALDRENSDVSDSSETSSQGFEISNIQKPGSAINTVQDHHIGQTQTPTVQSTPTKIEGINNNDPLTPTANLKMLMSVVSPAIRDREEKKKDLFLYNNNENKDQDVVVYTDSVDNVAEEVIVEKPTVYSRKDKSLGLLCQRFLAKFPENPGDSPIEICLDEVSKDLKVERRRVYDIVNVLESVEVLSRVAKNRYLWHGKTRIAQTLGRLKVLSRSNDYAQSKRKEKENVPIGHTNKPKPKMKRNLSSGDMPRKKGFGNNSQPLKERNLTKEDERQRIKAAIESTDHCRKDKSLGVLSQKFLIMFLLSKGGVVTLEDAANVLLEEHDDGNVKYKTKVRRLYDIANILSSLQLIEKVHIPRVTGKKPGFKWIGVDIDSLPESTLPTGPVLTFKTKHSLLPETAVFINNKCVIPCPVGRPLLLPSSASNNTADPRVRWSKSASCSAALGRRRPSTSGNRSLNGKKSGSHESAQSDGFLVHEFASSPVNVLGRDVAMYSPTDITFREELQKLKEKFPNRMSQLLAVLPFSPHTGNGNKSSRRNLFNQCKTRNQSSHAGEPNPKRLRANSVGDHVEAAGSNGSGSGDGEIPVARVEETTSAENKSSSGSDDLGAKVDNSTKFIHSTNSPFKVMTSCSYPQTSECQFNTAPANTSGQTNSFNCNEILQERQKQQALLEEQHQNHQKVESQWRQMVGQFRAQEAGTSGKRMVKLVDQAVSPIPPGKLPPARASIAVQASLINDISPLKPLMFVHHRNPSPWKLRAPSPSSAPPAPPSTPELPNELSVAPFQSQANTMYLRSMSPYPVSGSQSCGTSPVTPFTGARFFFPPSPSPPANPMNNLVFSQGNLIYSVNHVMAPVNPAMTSPPTNHHSNSCPSSINPSPTLVDPGRPFTPGIAIPSNQVTVVNAPVAQVPQQTPEFFSRLATVSTSSLQAQNVTPQVPVGKQPCMMVNNAGGLAATPATNMNQAGNDNISRKLCLVNENS